MKRDVLPTRELAALIESSECRLLRSFFEAAKRLRPESGFECLEIDGAGFAAFLGTASPLSHAMLAPFDTAVPRADLERLTCFFHDRGAPARISINPLSDPSLERELAGFGYVPCVRNNVLVLDATQSEARRDDRITEERDARAWGLASARGFTHRYASDEEGAFLATTIALGTGVVALSLREGEGIVATGAMLVHDGLASLFAGSTLGEHRGNGYHRAMILDRVARAREAGARYVRTAAPIASTSEANFRSSGFEVLYTRTAWELPVEATQAT